MATASVSSLGVGSNLDLSSILTKLMTAESEPLTALQSKITATNTKLSAFGTLKAKLATLQDTASKLKSSLNLNAMGASSSDSTIAKATTAFNAAAGTYTIKVDQLASAQKSFSNALASDATFTSGTLNFDFNGTVKSVELTGQTSYSLNDVRSAINAAGIGVTATVVSGDAGARLVLTGTQPGASGAFTLSATNGTGDTDSLDLSDLAAFDTTTSGLARSTAQDATFSIDGIAASSSSNTVTGKITGVTLNLQAQGTTTLTVAVDSSAVTKAVQSFVDAYNAVINLVKTNSTYDSTTKTAGAFNADSSVTSLRSQLSQVRSTVPTELTDATYKTLASLGVSINQDGTMSLASDTLSTALSSSASDVVKTLNAYGTAFANKLTSILGTGGLIENRVNGLNTTLKIQNNNVTALENRLAQIKKRYTAQFTALDKLMSQMQTTSTYLTQQLAQYTKSTS